MTVKDCLTSGPASYNIVCAWCLLVIADRGCDRVSHSACARCAALTDDEMALQIAFMTARAAKEARGALPVRGDPACAHCFPQGQARVRCTGCPWKGRAYDVIQAGLNHELCPECEEAIVYEEAPTRGASDDNEPDDRAWRDQESP